MAGIVAGWLDAGEISGRGVPD
jgi:hypothetical protein